MSTLLVMAVDGCRLRIARIGALLAMLDKNRDKSEDFTTHSISYTLKVPTVRIGVFGAGVLSLLFIAWQILSA